MLTQSEREWLEERDHILEKYGCYSWEFYRMREDDFGYIGDLFDALEFSERVAAFISKLYADKFADVVLLHARLAVEEEMDADRK